MQVRQDTAHSAHRPVVLSPNILVPQLLTQDRPLRKVPALHDVHCSALVAQVRQEAAQLEQNVLNEPEQMPAKN